MRRIPRQIRLDPTYDRRIREYIAGTGGDVTVTDVIHRALADFFRVQDGGATLERIAGDVHALGDRIGQEADTVAASVQQMRRGLEKVGADQARATDRARQEM